MDGPLNNRTIVLTHDRIATFLKSNIPKIILKMFAFLSWFSRAWWTSKRPREESPFAPASAVVPSPNAPSAAADCFELFDRELRAALFSTLDELVAAEATLRHRWTEELRYDDLQTLFETLFPLSAKFVAKADTAAVPPLLLLVLQNHVYDATAFVELHPGGPQILRMNAGSESWETFASLHSDETIANLLPTFKVGPMIDSVAHFIGEKPAALATTKTTTAAKPAAAARAPPKDYRVLSVQKLTTVSDSVTNPTMSIVFEGQVVIPAGGHMRVHCPADRNPKTQKAATRSYTPYETTTSTFTISVKHYPGGVVSGYLHSLKEGDVVSMSGPDAPHVNPRPADVNGDLLLIAGGTGIAPVFSIAKFVLEQTTHSVAIFACFRNAEDALLLPQLDELLHSYGGQDDGKLKPRCEVHIVFSRCDAKELTLFLQGRPPTSPSTLRGHTGRFDEAHVDVSMVAATATTAYVCGPPSFAQTVTTVLRGARNTSANLFPLTNQAEESKVVTRVFPL